MSDVMMTSFSGYSHESKQEKMSLFWRATIVTVCLSSFVGPDSVAGRELEQLQTFCPNGHFQNSETGQCQVCTHPCPRPLVETRACRHDADAVCGTPNVRAVDIVKRTVKLCPFDAFLNQKTGSCQECTKFCVPPFVMTSPCRRKSDAVCSQSQPVTNIPGKQRESSSRRRQNRKDRKRRKKDRKRTKDRSSRPMISHHSATSAQLCIDDGSQFYNLKRGRCFPCRSCDTPGFEEYMPCSSTSDRVCRSTHRGIGLVDQSGGAALESNELPNINNGDTRSEFINRSHNNEYPDLRIQFEGGQPPGIAENAQRDDKAQDRDNLHSIRNNIAD